MEERFEVKCPKCTAAYRVRYSVLGREAVCAKCKHAFVLSVPEYHNENEIMDWLADQVPQAPDATVAGLRLVETPGSASGQARSPAGPSITPAAPLRTAGRPDKLNLYKVDPDGAYFWFPARMLEDPSLRAAFPRMCCRTLSRDNLCIYLLAWPRQDPPDSAPPPQPEPHPIARLDQFPPVQRIELIDLLPVREDEQRPFNLPFPYYVSEGCSPVDLVHTSVSGTGNDQRCWLSIANIDVARRFFANVRGTQDHEYHKLRVHSRLRRHNHWEAISQAVRDRIMEWYQPLAQERILEFLPDEDTSETDPGSAGLIITDKRMVAHKDQVWRSYPLGDAVTVRTQAAAGGTSVEMYSMTHGRVMLRLSSESWANLTHFLKGLEASVKFVS